MHKNGEQHLAIPLLDNSLLMPTCTKGEQCLAIDIYMPTS